jgi:hypothetical protein
MSANFFKVILEESMRQKMYINYSNLKETISKQDIIINKLVKEINLCKKNNIKYIKK